MNARTTAGAVALVAAVVLGAYCPCALTAQTDQDPLDTLLSRVDRASKTIQDFRARVRQKKYFMDMGDEVTFLGTVVYARPRKMLWQFTEPDPSSLLITPDQIWLIVPGIKQVQKVGSRNKGEIDSFFMGFESSLNDMKKEYQVQWGGKETLEQGPAEVVKFLRPGDPFAAEVWIWFDSERGIPLRIRWGGAQGDWVTTDFYDAKINAGVESSVFELKIPAGYEVVLSEGL